MSRVRKILLDSKVINERENEERTTDAELLAMVVARLDRRLRQLEDANPKAADLP